MQYKYVCSACGAVGIVSWVRDISEEYECSNCGGRVKLEANKPSPYIENGRITYPEIAPELDKILLEAMTKELKLVGNQTLYDVVESMIDAQTRIKYRKYFLLAGGQIPENMSSSIHMDGNWFFAATI